jgi:hypothetical protein
MDVSLLALKPEKGISMSKDSDRTEAVQEERARSQSTGKPTIVLEVNAAYNRDGLTMPKPNGPNGRRVLNLEMLMNHPFYWEWLNERETEEVLMEIYIARTRRMQ